ncbi:MAG: glutaredoxin [Silvanigrellaceae bacterium]|nr:glutaredoxin [Silvanigrellaceae bacterium]
MSADVKIYTTRVCPYCVAVKKLFDSLEVKYTEVSLDNDATLREKLSQENNGWRTVPMVFINGKFIGGFDDTNALHKKNELVPLLNS